MKHRTYTSLASIIASLLSVLGVSLAGIFANLALKGSMNSVWLLIILILALMTAVVATYFTIKFNKSVTARKKNQIMLIYAKEDTKSAKEVYSLLTKEGFKTWMDIQDILPGQIWRNSIVSAIEESKLFVVLLSKNAFKNSGFVSKELSLVLDVLEEPQEGFSSLIPVRIEPVDVTIDKLKEIEWVDLFSDNGSDRLVKTISFLMNKSTEQSNLRET